MFTAPLPPGALQDSFLLFLISLYNNKVYVYRHSPQATVYYGQLIISPLPAPSPPPSPPQPRPSRLLCAGCGAGGKKEEIVGVSGGGGGG